MTIEELAKKYAHAIPNSKLVKYYEAAIPQFSMEMILTMQKEKPLYLSWFVQCMCKYCYCKFTGARACYCGYL